MTRDELEFTISQYLDGNLAEADESALESRLATDIEARTLLAEYRGLDRFLRAAPAPAVDFDALASQIARAVAAQESPAPRSYRLHWVRTASALALAACVVIAAVVGIRRLQPAAPGTSTEIAKVGPRPGVGPRTPRSIVVVDAVNHAAPSTAPVDAVAVGPSAAPQDRPALARYHEDLLTRPSQVIIARSAYAAQDANTQDNSLLPY